MPATPAVHIAPEVAELLTPAVIAEVNADQFRSSFRCFICRETGAATRDIPASLIVMHTATGSILSYAHRRCAPSQIVDFSDLPHARTEKINLVLGLWLRTEHAHLRAMVIVFPTAHVLQPIGEHDVAEQLTSQFAQRGFAMLGSLDDDMPQIESVHAELDDEHLHLGYPDRDGPVIATTFARHDIATDWPGWLDAAIEEGQIGVVIATGTNAGLDSEPIPALLGAIRAGRAMGAAATLRQAHTCQDDSTTGRVA